MTPNPLPKPRGSNPPGTASHCHGTATFFGNEYRKVPRAANGTATTASHTPLFRVAVVTVGKVGNSRHAGCSRNKVAVGEPVADTALAIGVQPGSIYAFHRYTQQKSFKNPLISSAKTTETKGRITVHA